MPENLFNDAVNSVPASQNRASQDQSPIPLNPTSSKDLQLQISSNTAAVQPDPSSAVESSDSRTNPTNAQLIFKEN